MSAQLVPVTIKTYDLAEWANRCSALHTLLGPLPETLQLNAEEILLVVEYRREKQIAWFKAQGANVLRVKVGESESAVIVDPSADPANE